MGFKYKQEKISPGPGRYTDLTVTINSLVDNPANLQNFISVKGIKTDMSVLTNQDRKDLEAQGLSPATIEKAVSDLPPEQKDPATKGLISVLKSVFGIKSEPEKSEPITIEVLKSTIKEVVKEELAAVIKNDAPTEADDQAELDKVQKEIDAEKAVQTETSDIKKQLADKKAELEEIKKMRVPGNATSKANELPPNASPEVVAKAEFNNIFKGTALEV